MGKFLVGKLIPIVVASRRSAFLEVIKSLGLCLMNKLVLIKGLENSNLGTFPVCQEHNIYPLWRTQEEGIIFERHRAFTRHLTC
jgi:hypothetical protein